MLILLIAFNIHSFFLWLIFVFLFLLDLANVFSVIYLFNLVDFLHSLKYFINYSFSINQIGLILFLFSFIISTFCIFKFLKSKVGDDKWFIRIFIIMFIFTISLDILNGSSILSFKKEKKYFKGNVAGFSSKELYHFINTSIPIDGYAPNSNSIYKESISFKQFAKDTTNNQMIIIVESMGLIEDTIKRKLFQQSITNVFKQMNWKTTWGQTTTVPPHAIGPSTPPDRWLAKLPTECGPRR